MWNLLASSDPRETRCVYCRFLPSLEVLQQVVGKKRLQIVHGDILLVDEAKLLIQNENPQGIPGQPVDVKMVGNLPFNISTPLMLKWLYLITQKKGPFINGILL